MVSVEEFMRHHMYNEEGNSIFFWLLKVYGLFSASNILSKYSNEAVKGNNEEEIQIAFTIADPNFMLKGYIIECLLKTLWLSDGNFLVRKEKIENSSPENPGLYKYIGIPGCNDHDLIQISDKMNFNFKNEKRNFLKILSFYATSYGRYPITKRMHDNKINIPDGHNQLFRDIVIEIVHRIKTSEKASKDIIDSILLELK